MPAGSRERREIIRGERLSRVGARYTSVSPPRSRSRGRCGDQRCSPHERSDMRGTLVPDIAEPVIGRAFARPVGSSGLRSYKKSFIASVIWSRCPDLGQKIFLFYREANHRLLLCILSRKRGRRPSSLTSGQVAVDAGGAWTSAQACVRRSRVVLTPGLLASSPREVNASRGRWWQEAPIHQGEHDISRKAIAQGRPECFR
jgi:hypothetical protein